MSILYEDDPVGWLYKVERYFRVNRVSEWERRYFGLVLVDGDA